MDVNEKEAVLSLAPYFSKDRIIVDAGSNKGDWSDFIIHNVDEAHLFEPNIKLLHYSEIRFCHLKGVKYHQTALLNKEDEADFYCLDNENNGMSTLVYHDDWQEFDVYIKTVYTNKLDNYDIDHIDFLKIDVEGVEDKVLRGCEQLLKEGKIKFIQFEFGHTNIKSLLDFTSQYGYHLYTFDSSFKKINSIKT